MTISAIEHSSDVWDYVDDIPGLPNRGDRDVLRELGSRKGRARPDNRAQVWDYFFRPLPSQIGGSVRAEIQQLSELREVESRRLAEESSRVAGRIEQRRQEAASRSKGMNYEISELEAIRRRDTRKYYKYIALLAWLGGSLFGPYFWLFIAQETTFSLTCLSFLALAIGSLLLIIAAVLAIRVFLGDLKSKSVALKNRVEHLRGALLNEVASTDFEIRALTDSFNAVSAEYAARDAERCQRLSFLNMQLQSLLDQIPQAPDGETVHAWLLEDLDWLKSHSMDELGLRGRGVSVVEMPENQAYILGPAELQVEDLIPPHYRESGSDESLHLQAIREETLVDGRDVVLLGAFYAAFLFITEDELLIYRAFYDFITGEPTQEVSATYFYSGIVSTENVRSHRRIVRGNGNSIDVRNAHSLKLSFNGGQVLELTWPDREYLRKAGVTTADSTDLQTFCSEGIESAIRNLKKQVSDRQREE